MNESKKDLSLIQVQLLFNNNYLVIDVIGQGGFGVVCKAYDLSLKNFVAIKKLNPEYSKNVKFIEMFYNEAIIARNLVHDNIVRVHHFWHTEQGEYYILMDYVKGKSLEYILNKCIEKNIVIPWPQIVFLTAGLCKVLDYLHRLAKQPLTGHPYNIVFMDLNPSNVMISYEGEVKITDFGISKTSRTLQTEEKQKNTIAGKYGYMSPEQLLCEKDIDYRTDIFSCGLIFYELLSGIKQNKKSIDEFKNQILNEKYDFNIIRQRHTNLNERILDILIKSLKREKSERYSSSLEMYNDLREIFSEITVEDMQIAFSAFLKDLMREEIRKENLNENLVHQLDLHSIMTNQSIKKIKCQDFIPGSISFSETQFLKQNENITTQFDNKIAKDQEKGKTVFEEVGNWLVQNIKMYKRTFLILLTSLITASFVFLLLDIFLPNNLTSIGRRIHSTIFPPNLIIRLTPGNAQISLTSRKGEKILSNLSVQGNEFPIKKILPGSYELIAKKDGYKPINQIVTIDPYSNKKTQIIELKFSVDLNINSVPQAAEVYINGAKVGKTPLSIEAMADKIALQLHLEGFTPLGSSGLEEKEGMCFIDFSKSNEYEIFKFVDTKYWERKTISSQKGYNIHSFTGNFFKNITIDSSPRDLIIFIDGKNVPSGITPSSINLTYGKHTIKLTGNPSYQDISREISIDKNTPNKFYFSANKFISFYAFEKETLRPIKSNVFIESKDKKIKILGMTTPEKPFKIALPLSHYVVKFDAGNNYTINILETDLKESSKINGYLEYSNSSVKFTVIDRSSIPISNAYIWIDEKPEGILLGRTDQNGKLEVDIPRGKKSIKISAEKYQTQILNIRFHEGKEEIITVVLDTSQIICPNCKKEYPPDTKFRFCTNCGSKLPEKK